MRKISPKQYALSLYQALDGKKAAGQKEVFENFLKLVWRNKDWKNLDKIVKSFGEVYCEENNILEAELTTARDLSDSVLAKVKKWLAEYSAKDVSLKTSQQPDLLGGLTISFDNTVYDASLKTQLKNLQNNFNK